MSRNDLAVTLISHASAVMEAGGQLILTDPWLTGSVFNRSWSLIAPAAAIDYDGVDWLWISHEHPDHFHPSSLRAMPAEFRERVTVLFQQSNDHPKMVAALRGLGFPHIRLLPDRRWTPLGSDLELLCYQSGAIDSALAMRSSSGTILNLNDCEIDRHDLADLRRLIGAPAILLKQFSIASFEGDEAAAQEDARRVADQMIVAHRALGADVTIPFASFAKFSAPDNQFLNDYANRPGAIAARMSREGLACAVLRPGERFAAGSALPSPEGAAEWDRLFDAAAQAPPAAVAERVEWPALEVAFAAMREQLWRSHGAVLRLLPPVTLRVPDLECVVRMDFGRNRFTRVTEEPVLEVASQPLHFMLSHTFGVQTLGVSGRYRLLRPSRAWRLHRIVFSMLNAGVGLSAAHLFDRRQIGFLWRRKGNLIRKLWHRAAIFSS